MKLEPAFSYRSLKGDSSDGKFEFKEINQQAKQMDDFALCVKNKVKSRVPGEMGLRDVKILMAIYEAMQSGKRVEIKY
jgi:predicted dehydrogenase